MTGATVISQEYTICTLRGSMCEHTVKKGGNAESFALLIKKSSSLSEGLFVWNELKNAGRKDPDYRMADSDSPFY